MSRSLLTKASELSKFDFENQQLVHTCTVETIQNALEHSQTTLVYKGVVVHANAVNTASPESVMTWVCLHQSDTFAKLSTVY